MKVAPVAAGVVIAAAGVALVIAAMARQAQATTVAEAANQLAQAKAVVETLVKRKAGEAPAMITSSHLRATRDSPSKAADCKKASKT